MHTKTTVIRTVCMLSLLLLTFACSRKETAEKKVPPAAAAEERPEVAPGPAPAVSRKTAEGARQGPVPEVEATEIRARQTEAAEKSSEEAEREASVRTKDRTAVTQTNSAPWIPPIGIPRPEFGVDESHRMFAGKKFKAGGFDYKDAGYGPYTHYVDNTHKGATDKDNPYGTPDRPRRSIPTDFPAGAVVEIHGGPYGTPRGRRVRLKINSQGTAAAPVFIRGANRNSRPRFFRTSASAQGSYLIIENIHGMGLGTAQGAHHISFRHNEQTPSNAGNCDHVVIYNNHIHDMGDRLKDHDGGSMGVNVLSNSNRVWIVDNHLHHNGDDDIHGGHRGKNIHNVFVGRNELHHARENALDFKAVNDVIISQNRMYSYRAHCSSGGDAMRINDEGSQSNVWIIFNEIFDSRLGIAPYQCASRPHVIGNVIYDCDTALTCGSETVINNTFFDVGTGIALNGIPPTSVVSGNIIGLASKHLNIQGRWASDTRIENNLLWQPDGSARPVGKKSITGNPLFKNVPAYSIKLKCLEFHSNKAVMERTDDNKATRTSVPGVNLEALGVMKANRVSVKYDPEAMVPSRRPSWKAGWQRVASVTGETMIMKRNIAKVGAKLEKLEINVWYYPNTKSELFLEPGHGLNVRDTIEIDYDGIPRKIISILSGDYVTHVAKAKDRIVFDPPTRDRLTGAVRVANWKQKTHLKRDFSIMSGSPAIDNATPEEDYETFRKTWKKVFKELNCEELLDIRKGFNGRARLKGLGMDIGAHEGNGK